MGKLIIFEGLDGSGKGTTSSPPFSTDVGSVLHCLLRQLQPGHG